MRTILFLLGFAAPCILPGSKESFSRWKWHWSQSKGACNFEDAAKELAAKVAAVEAELIKLGIQLQSH